jgi:hypothetical protein
LTTTYLTWIHAKLRKLNKKLEVRGETKHVFEALVHIQNDATWNNVAQMVLDPLQAIIEAIKGSKYKDTEAYKQDQIKNHQDWLSRWQAAYFRIFFNTQTRYSRELLGGILRNS